MNENLAKAKEFLAVMRKGHKDYPGYLALMLGELEDGGLSLADIGTNEAELEILRVKGCKIRATMWLDALRTSRDRRHVYAAYLRENLEKGGLSPADIGTTEKEINSLAKW